MSTKQIKSVKIDGDVHAAVMAEAQRRGMNFQPLLDEVIRTGLRVRKIAIGGE